MSSKSVHALQRDIAPEQVLRAAGLAGDRFEARHGWSNRAWVGEAFVVRVSSGRLEGSLEHERRIVDLLHHYGIPVAGVVGNGRLTELPEFVHESGEWIVSRRLPGDTLARVWSDLDPNTRRDLGVTLGGILRSLHGIALAPVAPRWWLDAHTPELLRNAYRPRVELGRALVAAVRELPGADLGLLDETEALIDSRLGLFAADAEVLVHGDLHGHNILVAPPPNPVISGLLDWEGARTGPADLELDMFLRWCTAADDFPQSPGSPSYVRPGDCLELIDHMAAGYPELFETPNLKERLEVYDALWHLVQLLYDGYWRTNAPPATETLSPTWGWLRALLDGKSRIARLHL